MAGDQTFPTVTICGSMRFYAAMLEQAELWTSDGWIVLMPFVTKSNNVTGGMLDEMHRQKIDMAETVVFVVGPERYMGESTTDEYKYATEQRKQIVEVPDGR